MSAFKEAQKLQIKIEKILERLETEYSDKLIEQLTRFQEQYEAMEGYSLQAKAEEILEGIGFTTNDLHRPLREFSGGWRMRVMLAKLLLEKPSILLMDEPTNHLDLPSIEWVENYLNNYEGAYVIVSHDRRFLNDVTNKTVEVANQDLIVYEGNYDFYLQEKTLRNEIQRNSFQNQQQKIKQTEQFINRFRAKSSKARQVQSKVKALDRLDKIEDIVDSNPVVNFKFDFKQKSGRHIIDLENISKEFDPIKIFQHTTAHIERGDKIALIGANGKGKSTLLRIIAGSEPLQEGERKEGFNVIKGFYAQHQLDSLGVENEILDELKQAGSGKTEQELRNVLGCFLFSNDDVFKKIKVLSGGEKSRVALAKTLISEANFLLLDEPTNHLDFQSENILIQALQQYQGTFVIVSHNRYFITQTANKIWYIEDHEIKEYPGSYEEFEYWHSSRTDASAKQKPKEKSKQKPAKTHTQSKDNEAKKLQEEMQSVEERIERLEAEVLALEEKLADQDTYAHIDKLKEATEAYDQVKNELQEANTKWETLAEKIDQES
jgi:ATP-binding cassette subfamily F protein 3